MARQERRRKNVAYQEKDGQGALFIKQEAKGNQPVLKGYLSYKDERIALACWLKTAKSGKQYYSLSVDKRAMDWNTETGLPVEVVADEDVPF